MAQDFSLAKVFADLAEDKSWPGSGWDLHRNPYTMVRLALMVVGQRANLHYRFNRSQNPDAAFKEAELDALEQFGINPDHYTEVARRVKEAEG